MPFFSGFQGPEQARVTVNVLDDIALCPYVVAGGDDIDAGVIKGLADLGGDAEAARRVLAVDDDEVELKPPAQVRDMFKHCLAAGFADHVAAMD